MTESVRILVLDDNPTDAELAQFELEEARPVFTSKVVMTEEDFVRELQEFTPDQILSDYDLPGYNGALALAESKRSCPDIPFILVTGAVTEDRAIDILSQGAKDYVLKTRFQQRLAPAVRRALAPDEGRRGERRSPGKGERRTGENDPSEGESPPAGSGHPSGDGRVQGLLTPMRSVWGGLHSLRSLTARTAIRSSEGKKPGIPSKRLG